MVMEPETKFLALVGNEHQINSFQHFITKSISILVENYNL